MRIDLVGTTADFRGFGPRLPLLINHLPCENRRTAGRIGEDGLGQIGFSDRSGYTAIGTVCNLAARLCAEARDGQILVSSHIAEAVKAVVRLENIGNLELKGLRRPVAAFNVVQSTSAADTRPSLTVVERGPGA